KCIIFIPDSYQTKRIDEMQELGAEIRREPGDYEDSVTASQLFAETSDSYDANPGGKNTSLQLRAYGEIAKEIYDELRDAPRIVAAPVSNGTMLAGIYKGFLSLYRRGKTSRMPLIVAGSAFGKNPIILAYLQQKQTCEDLDREQIKETSINEPLVNWHSFDGDLALEGIYGSHGWAANVSDQRMVSLSRLIREKEGLMVLPASTAGLAALLQAPNPGMIQNDRFVVILTSRK
ncbi:MAG: pyridoxal-phosphate dependent enzyme, partial [Saprospiraceae bacterium]|nr:pyridoxal-phosphate dependent enzyme [Saprospiraceae bacterium]